MANPKSAYSVSTKKEKSDTHIIVVWVDNEAGVLARVVGLFSGRGYNIESLAVAEVDAKKNISRITIVTIGTPQVIDQIKLQLKKLVPIHKVADFKRNDKSVIFKEMALFKFVGNINKIKKAINACKKYNAVILDKTKKSNVIQITALRRDIDKVSKNMERVATNIASVAIAAEEQTAVSKVILESTRKLSSSSDNLEHTNSQANASFELLQRELSSLSKVLSRFNV